MRQPRKTATRSAVTVPACNPVAAFGHPRDYLGHRHVYAVISQRARGLSLGINLNPDKDCSFDCVYCEVNRDRPGRVRRLNLKVMLAELSEWLERVNQRRLREIEWFRQLPDELLELKEVALSGEGEPTLCPDFAGVVAGVCALRAKGCQPFKIVLITNTTGLDLPEVQRGLRLLAPHDEVWAKLDAGSQKYMTAVNRPSITLEQVLENILQLARWRPVVIQSLFPAHPDARLTRLEIERYARRLLDLKNAGARIALVQVYSAHRPPHRPDCGHLSLKTLSHIARRVRQVTSLRAEVF
jgi:wyosine [tRNA(Phe)-imidazoG37] synthetase (radical SAM superfamily)